MFACWACLFRHAESKLFCLKSSLLAHVHIRFLSREGNRTETDEHREFHLGQTQLNHALQSFSSRQPTDYRSVTTDKAHNINATTCFMYAIRTISIVRISDTKTYSGFLSHSADKPAIGPDC